MHRLILPILALSFGIAAAEGLFVIPDPGAQATDGYVVVYRTSDLAVALGIPSEDSRILDSGAELEDYALVTIRNEGGLQDIAEIGEPVYRDHHSVIVRLARPVPDPFVRPGIHHVQPLRENRAPAEAVPVPMRSGYDDTVGDIVGAVNQDSLISYTTNYQSYLTRHSSTDGFDTACAWSQERFESMGLAVEIQPFPMGSYNCQNVIATQTGQVYHNRYWVICGHLDSTSPNPYYNAPGADDNGSGSATVMEAARIMSQYQFPNTVRFVCFGAEELGLIGSEYYAGNAFNAGDPIVAVMNLDMILYGPEENRVLFVPYNTISENIAVMFQEAASTHVPELELDVTYSPGTTYSDHASFWQQGYPALLGIEAAVDDNPYYHQDTDILSNYDQYWPFGTECARAALAFVAEAAFTDWLGIQGGAPAAASLSVFPNPASGSVHAAVGGSAPESLSLYDLSGRRVLTVPGGTMDVTGLSAGVYFVRTSVDGLHLTARVVIAR